MKFLIIFVALFAVALAAPPSSGPAAILRSDSDVRSDGFNYAYETSDGTKVEESGNLVNPGSEDEFVAVKGFFTFVADDGQTYTVNYIADQNGFQPQGSHLPAPQQP